MRSFVSRPKKACEHLTVPRAMSSRVLVIIPAFQEEAALPGTLRSLDSAIHDAGTASALSRCDVVVIDDGSTDSTARVAALAGARVVSLPFNLGIGGALQTGFRYAVREGYGAAVQFDADGQHVAEFIDPLVGELDRADLAVGSRFSEQSLEYRAGRVRRLAMRLLGRIVNRGGLAITDPTSGFRAFGPRALELFAASYPTEYLDSTEALVLARNQGLRIAEIPVDMHERTAGVASTRSWRLLFHYVRLLVVLASRQPHRP